MSKYMTHPASGERGFTLMEILISVLVLSVGLLGLASLQAAGLSANNSAYFRTQAIHLANDMADKIRANPVEVTTGTFNNVSAPVASPTDCSQGTNCTTTEVAQHDIAEWYGSLASELPGATGTITRNAGTQVVTVSVMWDDARTGANGTGCTTAAADMFCFNIAFIP